MGNEGKIVLLGTKYAVLVLLIAILEPFSLSAFPERLSPFVSIALPTSTFIYT
jgi:hypothetical protein